MTGEDPDELGRQLVAAEAQMQRILDALAVWADRTRRPPPRRMPMIDWASGDDGQEVISSVRVDPDSWRSG